VDDESRITGVGDHGIDRVKEAGLPSHLAEPQRAAVGGEPSAVEIRDDFLAPLPGKGERLSGTLCDNEGLPVGGSGSVLNPNATTC
jgi:hypothetical protein